MLSLKSLIVVLLCGSLSACALSDIADATPLPPITLLPPPALNITGTCDDTKVLENWLQVTSILRTNFQTQMNTAAAKSKAEMHADVLSLAAVRDSSFEVITPDCAAEASLQLSDAMSQAVAAFQAYVNGDAPDLGNTITNVNRLMDEVAELQTALTERMNTQFQQQRQATATTQSS